MIKPSLIVAALMPFAAACASAQQPEPSPRPGSTVQTVTVPGDPPPATAWAGYVWQWTSYGGRRTKPVVTDVTPDSPASRAGLAVGDSLVSVDGDSERRGWFNLNTFGTPGRTYRVRFRRNGEEHEVLLTPEAPRTEPQRAPPNS